MTRVDFKRKLAETGLSLRELAILTGISWTQCSRYERGLEPAPSWMQVFLEIYAVASPAAKAAAYEMVLSEPEWKIVPGFPDYEVSETGRVRRTVATNRAPACEISAFEKAGYLHVNLYKNGAMHGSRVHRLVAIAFLGDKSSEGRVVCHKDGDPKNNSRQNLYWGTHQDNATDRRLHEVERHKARLRSRSTRFRAKLVQKIKRLRADQAKRIEKSTS